MNLLIKHSKKFILAVLLFTLIITANFGLLNATITSVYATDVYGFNGFTDQVNVDIKNNDFSSNSSTENGYPYTPKNFTFKSVKTSNAVKHGLVNLNKTTYKNNYEKYGLGEKENPGLIGVSDDNYSLMINSREESSSCGYVSDEFTLNKNGIYHVSVNVYTDDVDGAASLYLFNGEKVFASIKNINTEGDWGTNAYHFLIKTKDYEDLTLTLGLWQGSQDVTAQACVMFDEVSAGQISASTLQNMIKNTSLDGVSNTNYKNVCFVALDGKNQLDSTSITINSDNVTLVEEESNNIGDSAYSEYFFNTTKSELKINNVKANNICFETEEYELLANKVYKFSVLAKLEDLTTGSAFFKAVQIEESDNENPTVTFTSTTNNLNDDYTEYSIIIVSDPLETTSVKFQLGLGTADSKAKGTLYVNGITARSVPYTEFNDADTTTSKTLDLSASYDLSSIDNLVGNFAFYNSEATDVSLDNQVAINSPKDWAITKSSNGFNQQAGVFNVKDFNKLIKTNLPNISNPGFIESVNKTTNNILMLHNSTVDKISATSTSFKLTKETYYKVSIWVNTQVEENGATIKISKKDNSSFVLGELNNINTNGVWEEVELLIKTGYEDLDVNLVLALGTDEEAVKGYAFFDNCFVNTSTEDVYTSATNKVDLSNPLAYADNKTPTYFKGNSSTSSNNAVSYLLNLEDLTSVLTKNDRENALNTFVGNNKNVLAIHSTNTDDYYTLTSMLNYYLTSGSYYKVSVDVYTAYLTTDVENGVAGASVKLTNLDNGEFTGIVSPISSETNKGTWTTYTFFINPDNNVTTELVLGLGDSNTACHGTVLFGNINFETIDSKETYLELTQNVNDSTKVLGTVITEDEEETIEETDAEINWQLIVYTLTAVAVIVAVLGVGFKKVLKPGKKRVKRAQPDYDRTSSMSRQKYRRLAYIKRDKDIRKLEKELALLNADKLDKEDKYKQLLSKVREVKLANRDGKLNSELSSLNKNLTKASHNVAKIGVMVNKIKNEIALMKTEGYLQGLERKLMKQDELAKSKGYSIEEMILSEGEEVEISKDSSLDDAISKAEQIIEDKKEEERLALEKAEQERLEQERLEQEKREQEKREQERLEKEAAEQAKVEEVVEEQSTTHQEQENVEVVPVETVEQENVKEIKTEESEQIVETESPTESTEPTEAEQVESTEPTEAEQVESTEPTEAEQVAFTEQTASVENAENTTETEETSEVEQEVENTQNEAEMQENAQNSEAVEQKTEEQEEGSNE